MTDGAKTWMFTVNNWTPEELDNILKWDVTRMRVAEEVGEEGTPHLQGCVTFLRKYRLAALKKLQSRAHWEVAKAIDAFNYECKDGCKVHEIDNRRQGKRSDLEGVYALVESGKGLWDNDFWLLRPNIQAIRVAEKFKDYHDPPRRIGPITVIWIYGKPGYGKSALAYDSCEGQDYYSCSDAKWWNGYSGQDIVIIDDFRPDWCSFRTFLRIADIYPFQVEFKGGMRQVQFTKLLITCPFSPKECFMGYELEDIEQVTRRITKVIKFTEPGEWTDVTGTGTEVGEGNTGPSPPKRARIVVDLTEE